MILRLCLITLLLFPFPARADAVEQAIDHAKRAYQEGQHTKAANQLRYAAGLIGEEGVKRTRDLLPQPPTGWAEKTPEREQVNYMGGFISLVREYHKGETTLVLRSSADSPMFYELVQALSGKKVKEAGIRAVSLGKRPALLIEEKEGKQASLAVPLENGVLVTISGNAGSAELMGFASAIDLGSLARL
jgi:hypothetical protein